MTVLIVDDEENARNVLGLLVRHHISEVTDLRLANGGYEASQILKSFEPDIVFLDIKMPDQDGFSWLRSLEHRNFDVIFTTAYDQYAIKAIRYSAFDYLLKPVDVEDLRAVIDRYLALSTAPSASYENLFYNTALKDSDRFRLAIRTSEGTYYLDPANIVRCKAEGNYTLFVMSNSKQILVSKPVGHYESLLNTNDFIRCHKSHLVNRHHVTAITDKMIYLDDGSAVEVSRRRMTSVKQAMSS